MTDIHIYILNIRTSLLYLNIIYIFNNFMEFSKARKDNQVKAYQSESFLIYTVSDEIYFELNFYIHVYEYIYIYIYIYTHTHTHT